MVEEKTDMNLYEAACIIIGADVMFNNGMFTNRLLITFYDVLKAHFDSKKPITYTVSQEDLVDAGFGC